MGADSRHERATHGPGAGAEDGMDLYKMHFTASLAVDLEEGKAGGYAGIKN